MKKNRLKKKVSIDRIWMITIAIVLLIISILSFSYIREIIGHAISIPAEAGTITEIILEQRDPATDWQGYYGLVIMMQGYDEIQSDEAISGRVEPKHFVFNCLQPDITHELLASVAYPLDLDWNDIRPATPEMSIA